MLIAHEGGVGTHLVHPFAGLHPLQHAHDVLVVAGAHDGAGLRQGFEQLLLKVLSQAAGDDQLLALFRQLHQGAHRFLPCVLNEAAGVHHHHAGLTLVGTHAIAGLGQQAEHVLGVHPVLLAAEVGERNRLARRCGVGWRLVHGIGLKDVLLLSGLMGPRAGQSFTLLRGIKALPLAPLLGAIGQLLPQSHQIVMAP